MNIDIPEGFDVETELEQILREEICKEITAETGKTRQDLDNEILAAIREIAASKEFTGQIVR